MRKAILGPVSVAGAFARERLYSLTAPGGKVRGGGLSKPLIACPGGEPGLNRS
jgi:hypothetical protein